MWMPFRRARKILLSTVIKITPTESDEAPTASTDFTYNHIHSLCSFFIIYNIDQSVQIIGLAGGSPGENGITNYLQQNLG
jgi:hypothetical protein